MNNTKYKLCVHTRKGDFTGLGETQASETGAAIEYIMNALSKTMVRN